MELKHDLLLPLVHSRLREYIGQSWAFELVAKMTSSTEATVSGWLIGNEPNGERLIRLWHLLAARGIKSPELDELPKLNHYCGELLTFGVITLDEVRQIFGHRDPQRTLAALRGTPPMHPHFTYDQLKEMYDDQLQESKRQLPPLKQSVATPRRSAASQRSTVPEVVSEATRSGDPPLLLASLLGAALPIVRHLNSEDASPEDRSRLRTLMGETGMFELSNHFEALCSERARNQGRPPA